MNEQQVVYKVVTCNLYSAFAKYDAGVEYIVGKPVNAPPQFAKLGYKLTAFQTYEQAKNYICVINTTRKLFIYKAVATEVKTELPRRFVVCPANRNDLVWYINQHTGIPWPRGTVMCDSITLVEKMFSYPE